MMLSAALRAPASPPDTGASTAPQPRAAATSAISLASAGSVVVKSTSSAPGFRLGRMASSPSRMTRRTSAGKPTMVHTTSDALATSAGESTYVAPASTSGCALLAVRL